MLRDRGRKEEAGVGPSHLDRQTQTDRVFCFCRVFALFCRMRVPSVGSGVKGVKAGLAQAVSLAPRSGVVESISDPSGFEGMADNTHHGYRAQCSSSRGGIPYPPGRTEHGPWSRGCTLEWDTPRPGMTLDLPHAGIVGELDWRVGWWRLIGRTADRWWRVPGVAGTVRDFVNVEGKEGRKEGKGVLSQRARTCSCLTFDVRRSCSAFLNGPSRSH
ncbi:hypothetical protein B0H11DRAFT_317570 [Mycena galericulata]|nr:hypothetical protein B0H11DRAFT_317570 [Mycena galericulata]